MAYLVLARKYRPQTFDDVVGQEHVTRTLKNAIGGGRVAHAMLFSGPRGTGKTTIARILAKAMNCERETTSNPCNVCRSCMDITAGRGADVFEIDGASNNSVDQVRELRENIRYMPVHSRYKIYIIDEVHMLSIAAFNALLKTLEEPPAHILFFFATTEVHKIPVTILSRCQRHDLKRIDLEAVAAHLDALCQRESVDVSEDNLRAIARESGGSMRDALSLLDQILACGDSQVDDDYVARLLGGMDRQTLFDLSAAIFSRNINRALTIVANAYKDGQDLKRFYVEVLAHFRHLMLIKLEAGPDMLDELTADEIDFLNGQVSDVSAAFIDQVFTLLFAAEPSVRHASQPRLAIEMALFKIQQITPVLPIDTLIERLDALLRNAPSPSIPGVVETQSPFDSSTAVASDHDRGGQAAGGLTRKIRSDAVSARNDSPRGQVQGDDASDNAWDKVLAEIEKRKPSIAAALSRSKLVAVSAEAFSVRVHDNDYTVNLLRKHLSLIESACREQAGRVIQIDFSGNAGEENAASVRRKADAIRQQLLNHPLVADAVDLFSGKIEEIKIK